jgi:hypothetical protein
MSAIRWQPERLIFYAFDLLHLNGKDLRDEPLANRRSKLRELIGSYTRSSLQFSDEFPEGGAALFRALCRTRILTLSKRAQQDLAQDEMLHREHIRGHRHRAGAQDRSTARFTGTRQRSRAGICQFSVHHAVRQRARGVLVATGNHQSRTVRS